MRGVRSLPETPSEQLNFDDEARKLFAKLNLELKGVGGRYNPLDPIWCVYINGSRNVS
jgi:hypothetical protein